MAQTGSFSLSVVWVDRGQLGASYNTSFRSPGSWAQMAVGVVSSGRLTPILGWLGLSASLLAPAADFQAGLTSWIEAHGFWVRRSRSCQHPQNPQAPDQQHVTAGGATQGVTQELPRFIMWQVCVKVRFIGAILRNQCRTMHIFLLGHYPWSFHYQTISFLWAELFYPYLYFWYLSQCLAFCSPPINIFWRMSEWVAMCFLEWMILWFP